MTPERETTTRDAPSRSDAPRRLPPVLWLLAIAGAIVVVCALAAVIFAGPAEAIAVVVVGVAAMIAASLWIAGVAGNRDPGGHPGRGAAERQAEALGGTTRGRREGGATPPRTDPLDELVEEDERDGARVDRGRG